ncbi:MAG: hypothetical protein AVDCRST_MAG83-3044 [uncultured Arthrobacter sp.]|uniref:Uncharacterized protein n=1 Tax=uncultured Arthrobacter sp. TaxID=114050 RepID=A0A6J4J378_9MICC|nr:hypothetical protein [uncultured Arthrobacter sp.]CAA9267068.1 MAG: hypothetical protein AVDCRST_MAG83-3044 [uncultured Arthrobacter sp.]
MELLSANVVDLQGRAGDLEELEALRLRLVESLLDARAACEQAEASGKDAGPGAAQTRLCEAVRALEEVDDLLFNARLDRTTPLAG